MSDLEIREQLARYIDGEIEARALEASLTEATWDADDRAGDIAADALRLLSEHRHGDWTDAELHERLGTLSRTYWLESAPKVVYGGSGDHVTVEDQPSASVGRWRAAVSA